MEVEIICRERIKPSSPTPNHLRTYKLSLLDQFMPTGHVPLLLFYPFNQTASDHNNPVAAEIFRSQRLKQSLSQTLTRFYPFAGKIKNDDYYIDCNDEGVYYVEAKINHHLSQILNQQPPQFIHKLVLSHDYPIINETESSSSSAAGIDSLVMIQVNFFACGGIVINACFSHKIFDGQTSITFLKAWAAIARGSSTIEPSFMAPLIFPQNQLLPKNWMTHQMSSVLKQGKCITRRFVFDSSAINTLKAQAQLIVQNPSGVEVVSAIIWKCAMAVSRARYGYQKPSTVSLAVDLRRRKLPTLPQNSIGNIAWKATAHYCASDEEPMIIDLHHLVALMRESTAKIKSNFVQELEGEKGYMKFVERVKEWDEVYSKSSKETDYFNFSSVCKLGLYETDFGWGKPMWMAFGDVAGGSVFMNLIFLVETRYGNGIEAWVSLDEPDMALLEQYPELLAFASLDPSPLSVFLARL